MKCADSIVDCRRNQNVDDFITLNVGEYKFLCSKEQLIRDSKYFETMFTADFNERNENSIIINDIDSESLRFILTRSAEEVTSFHEPLEILRTASILLFDKFLQECQRFISILIKDRSVQIMCVCKLLNINPLYTQARLFSLWHFKDLRRSNDVMVMEYHDFFSYINDSNLNSVDEFEVFQCLLDWLNFSLEAREKHMFDLMKAVRFKLLEPYYVEKMLKVDIVSSNLRIKALLDIILQLMNSDGDVNALKEHQTDDTMLEAALEMMSTYRRSSLLPCSICVVDGDIPCVLGFDGDLKRLFDVPKLKHMGYFLTGFKVINIGSKVYLVGGEYGMGQSNFNFDVWSFETTEEKWCFEGKIVTPRRHFFITSIGDDIFLIGGTGLRRVLLNSISKYNVLTGNSEECGEFKHGKIEAVCSREHLIYIATSERIWTFNPLNGIFTMVSLIPRGKVISFMNFFNDSLFFVDCIDNSISKMKLDLNDTRSEFIGKFNVLGEQIMLDKYIYSFSHGRDFCEVERLCVESKVVKLYRGKIVERKKISTHCRGTGCFIYPCFHS